MQNKLASLIFICILFLPFSVSGQKLVNSPYSRFNLGSLEPAGSFRSIGMGGIGIGVRDNSSIYYSNPASYSGIDTNSFVFDFGLDYGINYLSEDSVRHFSGDMNFDHLLLGFPITKGLGVAAGIIPFSNSYFNISESVLDEGNPDYDAITGGYVSIHSGEGGFTKFFLGSGLKITKFFSAGINMTMLFGSLTRTNKTDFVVYNNSTEELELNHNMFHNKTTEKLQLNGINFEYGGQVNAPLKDGFFIDAGISFSSGKHYNSRYENLAYLFTAYGSVDTLFHFTDSTRAFLPGSLNMGFSFGKKNKFIAGFDYTQTKWSEAKISGSGEYFENSRSYKFGAEYIPDKFSNYSFVKRMEYRVGGHFEDNYLVINGEQVKEYGISFGIGIPMRRSLSKTNLFFDYTKRYGSGVSALHKENCFTVGVSLNMYDFWFLKRKYD